MPLPFIAVAALEIAKLVGPSVVRMVAGDKAGKVAEEVVGIAQAVTGADSPDAALKALQANPDLIVTLKLRTLEHIETLERLVLADRQAARVRDVELQKAGLGNTRANWLIVGDVVGLLSCLAAMVWITAQGIASGGANDVLMMAMNGPLGMLTQNFANGLRDAHMFEFGSSAGSKNKDEMLSSRLLG